jgi:hypothetical protein
MAAGRGGRGEEPLGGTMNVGPHCSDDDGDVKVGFAAPSHVVLLQERKIYLLCVKIKSDSHTVLVGKGTPNLVQPVMLLTCIRKVPRSKIGRHIEYFDQSSS